MIVSNPLTPNSSAESHSLELKSRADHLLHCTTPLPGCIPYENCRPIRVSKPFDYWEVLPFLNARFPQLTSSHWEKVLKEGKLTRNNNIISPNDQVRAGNILFHLIPHTIEPPVCNQIKILFEDQALLVVGKPAPLPMHPSGRFNKNTLISFFHLAFPNLQPRIVHRLDRDTTGVVVFAKSREIARKLRKQFDENTVKKTYLAQVTGVPKNQIFSCSQSLSPKPEKTGIRAVMENGKTAHTDFEVLRILNNQTSLLSVSPLTGRTNQIRLHLCSLGLPIIGDRIYGNSLSDDAISSPNQEKMRLHASAIKLQHPISEDPIEFRANPPDWMNLLK